MDQTQKTYENPEFIAKYIKSEFSKERMRIVLKQFAKTIKGKKVIDIGCGPGFSSKQFADLGFEVTGIDLSSEMLKHAKTLSKNGNPHFMQMNMLDIDKFSENEFNGAWVCASMLHLTAEESDQFLVKLNKILKKGAKVFITVKEAKQGTRTIDEIHHNMRLVRDFTFWEEKNLSKLLEKTGYKIDKFNKDHTTRADWLNYFLTS